MAIWFEKVHDLVAINALRKDTLAAALGMEFVAIGENSLTCTMPVNAHTKQPMGMLHGGASAALAETVGSVASMLCIDTSKYYSVGLDINCNHIRGVKSGIVSATATPFHIGKTTHVWEIKITNEQGKLVCISRLTMAILKH